MIPRHNKRRKIPFPIQLKSDFMPRTRRKHALWAIICIVLFLIFIKQGELSNSTYNEDVKKESYSVKVMSIKKVREYYVTGIDTQGRHRKLVISPKWNLREVQVGESLIKDANSYDIKIITSKKSITLTPELPL